MSTVTNQNTAIFSSLGTDPDFGELVEMFVDEMPYRVSVLRQAFDGGDMEALRRAAHQIRGAAGSYGFDQLTPVAAAVEDAVAHHGVEEEICRTLESLLSICRQVRAGAPE